MIRIFSAKTLQLSAHSEPYISCSIQVKEQKRTLKGHLASGLGTGQGWQNTSTIHDSIMPPKNPSAINIQ